MLSIVLLAPLTRLAPRRTRGRVVAQRAPAGRLVAAPAVLRPLVALRARVARFLVFCALLAVAMPAPAEDAAPALAAGLVDQVRVLALDHAGRAGAARVEVVVGQLDPRLRLAPCDRIEPYLPPNVRLWGKSRIGLRCKEGRTAWNVYLPIVVKVWGRALVSRAGAAAGSVVAEGDLDEAEVDLAEELTPALFDRKVVVGRTLAQAIRPGQALRQAHLKSRQWFAAGDNVRVVAAGEGFALESVGQALTNGIEGEPARVRTESGRVVTGLPAGERRLELAL